MKKLAVTMICLLMMASAVSAFDDTRHVTVAPDGVGDAMIFPIYVATGGGWETKLTVINTSDVYSCVAKVVIRSGGLTQEILDFMIYLSPTDVWTGVLNNGPNGPRMTSSDDSCLSGPTTWASTTAMNQPLVNACGANDFIDFGYVTVQMAAFYNLGAAPVQKQRIRTYYDDGAVSAPVGTDRLFEHQSIDILTGYYEISNNSLGILASDRAVVLKDIDNLAHHAIGGQSFLGVNSSNSLGEIEAALAKTAVHMPYYNGAEGKVSLHVFTLPTKNTLVGAAPTCTRTGVMGPFFQVVPANMDAMNTQRVRYGLMYFNLREEGSADPGAVFSPVQQAAIRMFQNELNFVAPNTAGNIWKYNEGWAHYEFINNASAIPVTTARVANGVDDVEYRGLPVIPVVATFKTMDNFYSLSIAKGAYNLPAVTYITNPAGTRTLYPWYHSAGGVNSLGPIGNILYPDVN